MGELRIMHIMSHLEFENWNELVGSVYILLVACEEMNQKKNKCEK